MPDPPITSKAAMYRLLAAGLLGNTVPQFFSLAEWEASTAYRRYPLWGVRTLVPGGPCRLYVPRDEVRETASRPGFAAAGVNVSVMIDAVVNVTLYADVYDAPGGLLVYGVENPGKGASWRMAMPERGREYRGLAARTVLQRHLDPSSLADLGALFERWPGHVCELSACDRPFGTLAATGRRMICWEVRQY